jgi:hypothetical protein
MQHLNRKNRTLMIKISLFFLSICSLFVSCFEELPPTPTCFEDIESLEKAANRSIAICCTVTDDCIKHFVRQYGADYREAASKIVTCDPHTTTCNVLCSGEYCNCVADVDCNLGQKCQISKEKEVCKTANLSYKTPGWCQLCVDIQANEKDN